MGNESKVAREVNHPCAQHSHEAGPLLESRCGTRKCPWGQAKETLSYYTAIRGRARENSQVDHIPAPTRHATRAAHECSNAHGQATLSALIPHQGVRARTAVLPKETTHRPGHGAGQKKESHARQKRVIFSLTFKNLPWASISPRCHRRAGHTWPTRGRERGKPCFRLHVFRRRGAGKNL